MSVRENTFFSHAKEIILSAFGKTQTIQRNFSFTPLNCIVYCLKICVNRFLKVGH